MDMQVRKILTFVEESRSEAGQPAGVPLRKAAVVAIVKNPFAGHFASDLSALVDASAEIGRELSGLARDLLRPFGVESYGKGAVVGLAGEQEHGVAMLTTVFGDAMRAAAGGGKAWISSMTKRSGVPASIDIPLAHKDALYVRSHYDGISLTLSDAPLPEEIAVICAFANRERLNARVGGLTKDKIKGGDGLV
jgi:Amino acid synthesis